MATQRYQINNITARVVTLENALLGTNGEYSIVSYGAVGDDSTDNTTAIQAAIDAALAAGGGKVLIPEGIFRTGPLTVDTSAIADQNTPRIKILGVNKNASTLKMKSSTSGVLLSITGNSGAYQQAHVQLSSFRLLGQYQSNEDGLQITNVAFGSFEDIHIYNFGRYGLNIFDTDQSHFTGCTIRANLAGVTIGNGVPATTGPNSLVFTDCAISNNTEWGLDGWGLQAVTFVGGSIQYNGDTLGDSGNWGIRLVENNGAGYATINFLGTIFEGNRGKADVWVDYDTPDFVTVNFIGCSWYRTVIAAATYASTNGVLLDGNSTNLRANFQGNVWFDGGGYDDNAGRPWISNTNGAAKIYSDGSDFFRPNAAASTTLEHPNFSGYLHLPLDSGISFEFGDVLVDHSSGVLDVSTGELREGGSPVVTQADFGAWTAWTPTITAGAGTFTTVAASGAYKLISKTCWFSVTITITTAGTASGAITLPVPSGSAKRNTIVIANEHAGTGIMGKGLLLAAGTAMSVSKYDNTTFIADGNVVVVTGTYELA